MSTITSTAASTSATATALVLLTAPPTIFASSPNDVQNDPRWVDIVGGSGSGHVAAVVCVVVPL